MNDKNFEKATQILMVAGDKVSAQIFNYFTRHPHTVSDFVEFEAGLSIREICAGRVTRRGTSQWNRLA